MRWSDDKLISMNIVSPIEDIYKVFKTSYWIVSKYFIKCACCQYEEIIGHRHTAPRLCPKCGCEMIKTVRCE